MDNDLKYFLLSPDFTTALVTIPKNASSFVWKWALENGWKAIRINEQPFVPTYLAVILRDPIDRWKSAVVQFLHETLVNDNAYTDQQLEREWNGMVECMIRANPDQLDLHTQPQLYHHNELCIHSARMFFKFNERLNFNLTKTFKWKKASDSIMDPVTRNVGRENRGKLILERLVTNRLMSDENFLAKLRDIFAEDIEIYNKASFVDHQLTRRDILNNLSYEDF